MTVSGDTERRRALAQNARHARLLKLANKENDGLQGRTRGEIAQISKLTEEVQAKTEQLTEALQKSVEQTNKICCLQTELDALRKDDSVLREDLAESRNELTLATKRLQSMQKRSLTISNNLHYHQKKVKRLHDANTTLKRRIRELEREIAQKQPELTRTEAAKQVLAAQLSFCSGQLEQARSVMAQHEVKHIAANIHRDDLEKDVRVLQSKCQQNETRYKEKIESLRGRLLRKHEAIRLKLFRAKRRITHLDAFKRNALQVVKNTHKNYYSNRLRALIRKLCGHGVSLGKCGIVIAEFMKFHCVSMGIESSKARIRIPSPRTIARIIGEAGVASKLHLAWDMLRTKGFTTGGDGTTNKSQNFDARHINVQIPEDSSSPAILGSSTVRKVRFAEVQLEGNHRAETQMKGDVGVLEEIIALFNASPLAKADGGDPLNIQALATKYHGSHGDHAEDQKARHRLLAAWKEEMTNLFLGTRRFFALTEEERNTFVANGKEKMIDQLGGQSSWNSLTDEERLKKDLSLMNNLIKELAEEELRALPEHERRRIRLFVWTGCGMHKELNSVKEGDSAMQEEWKKYGIAPRILANKDNAAVLELAEEEDGEREATAAEKRAAEVSKAGGVKLGFLLGLLLNNKDDKKGWHHIFRDWAAKHLKKVFTFPDTSNTRYSSYLEAAAEILAHLDAYLEFASSLRFSKVRPTFSHLEENVYHALQDPPTLTELACLALYREAITVDYISSIRANSLEEVNALTLGPRLEKVRHHLKKLIDSPQLILSSQARPQEATLDGNKTWNRPDAIEAIQHLISQDRLPKLEALFRAFLTGALSAWERFSSEFNDDGIIAALTEAEKEAAWMPATNDANEGVLGSLRVFYRRNPNATLRLFNSLRRYKFNNTEEFIETVLTSEEDQKFLRVRARAEDRMGLERKRRREVTEEKDQERTAKKLKYDLQMQRKKAREARIRSTPLLLNTSAIKKMSIAQMRLQLAKFRKIYKNDVPAEKLMSRRAEKLGVLLALAQRYKEEHHSSSGDVIENAAEDEGEDEGEGDEEWEENEIAN